MNRRGGSSRLSAVSIGGLTICIVATGLAQESGQERRANPFSRPGYTVNLNETAAPATVPGPADIELRATLVAGDTALVNINGEILAVGQEYEGYRVVSIDEGRAVLMNNGERVVLNVYEQQQGSDEDSD